MISYGAGNLHLNDGSHAEITLWWVWRLEGQVLAPAFKNPVITFTNKGRLKADERFPAFHFELARRQYR